MNRSRLPYLSFFAAYVASMITAFIFGSDIAIWLVEALEPLPIALVMVIAWLPLGIVTICLSFIAAGARRPWSILAGIAGIVSIGEFFSLVRKSSSQSYGFKRAMATELGEALQAAVMGPFFAVVAWGAIYALIVWLRGRLPDMLIEPGAYRIVALGAALSGLTGLAIAMAITL